jgi:tetratricopeptide (TPR) repeat protein
MIRFWRIVDRNRFWWGAAVLALIVLLSVPVTFGSIPNIRLNRYDTRQSDTSTRFIFKLVATPDHSLVQLPDKRLRLVLRNSEAGFLTRLRGYSDRFIAKVQVDRRGDDLLLTFTLRSPADAYRLHGEPETGIINLDIGPGMKTALSQGRPAGREMIWSGAERLVKEYDPPLRSEIPFTPVNRTPVFALLNPEEAKLFQAGEGALYKGRASEAEEFFAAFPATNSQVRALVLSRLGEARYMLQKYKEARQAFQEAEQLTPNLSTLNPSAYFAYGDCIVRSGDLAAGRHVLGRLIAENAEKPYAQMLLVRLGDILLRNDRELEARAVYQTILTYFPTSKAASQARMKLADREIFRVDTDTYRKLVNEYAELRAAAGDFTQREEAAFKGALLQAMYGPVPEALTLVTEFEKRHPRSSYVQIMRAMHEDLLVLQVKSQIASHAHSDLLATVNAHRDALGGCLRLPEFMPALLAAYAATGSYRNELELFRYLIDHGVSPEQEAVLLAQMVESAHKIEDPQTTEWAARTFVERFPRHPAGGEVRERLAELLYRRGDHAGVALNLAWLLEKGATANAPLSYYYLGKSLQARNNLPGTEQALTRFIAATAGSGQASPLVADAYYALSLGRNLSGNRAGAIAAMDRGLALAAPERKDQFRYKLAELHALAGRSQIARQLWEQVAKEGKDPDWQALAVQSLAKLDVATQVERVRKSLSKK